MNGTLNTTSIPNAVGKEWSCVSTLPDERFAASTKHSTMELRPELTCLRRQLAVKVEGRVVHLAEQSRPNFSEGC